MRVGAQHDVNIVFHMAKDDSSDRATPNMVAAAARVLAARPEDAALVLDGNWVPLTRLVRKHRRSWWDNYGANQLIP